MGDTILRVDDIQKFYGNKGNLTKAIDHISFSVRKGEFLGIMGASGSGKTTLLNCISTIDTVTSGHIYVEEKDITALHGAQLADFRGKKLGFIFQNFNLLDTLTAYENISLALSIAGAKPSEIEQRIPQIAQALNIQDVLDKYPYQMSGGQQQRVAAARAMVTNPAIVLADEPTGALDSNSSRMISRITSRCTLSGISCKKKHGRPRNGERPCFLLYPNGGDCEISDCPGRRFPASDRKPLPSAAPV